MIRNGQAHLLDTSRVVDLSSQPYRGMGWLPPVDCQQPTKPSISIDELLVRAVRQGKTREATRATFQAKGLGFKDEQWTEARRFVLRERLGDAEAAQGGTERTLGTELAGRPPTANRQATDRLVSCLNAENER